MFSGQKMLILNTISSMSVCVCVCVCVNTCVNLSVSGSVGEDGPT